MTKYIIVLVVCVSLLLNGKMACEGAWSTGPSLSFGLAGMGSTYDASAGTIFIMGGSDGQSNYYNSMESLAINGSSWQAGYTQGPASLQFGSAVTAGEVIYAVGTSRWASPVVTAFNSYTPSRDAWNRLTLSQPINPYAYNGCLAAASDGSSLFYLGGINSNPPNAAVPSVQKFDLKSSSWTYAARMPTARGYLACATDAATGLIYAAGGTAQIGVSGNPWPASAALEVYNPHTDQWKSLAAMPVARFGAAMALYQGQLFVSGGFSATNASGDVSLLSSVSVYDVNAGSWSAGPDLPTPLVFHASLATPRGLYIIGGINQPFQPSNHFSNQCSIFSYLSSTGQSATTNVFLLSS